jgi:hypothetical protein
MLRDSVHTQRALYMEYCNEQGTQSERAIQPVGPFVENPDGTFTFNCFDVPAKSFDKDGNETGLRKPGMSTFRYDRIKGLKPLDGARAHDGTVQEYWKGLLGIKAEADVVVLFPTKSAQLVRGKAPDPRVVKAAEAPALVSTGKWAVEPVADGIKRQVKNEAPDFTPFA